MVYRVVSSLFFMLCLSVIQLNAQERQIRAAENYLASGHYEKAKEAITLALENDKTKNSVKAWYFKAFIYTQFISDSILSKQYKDAPEQALSAFKQARSLNEKEFMNYVLTYNAGQYLPFHIYINYYQQAVVAYNNKDFLTATTYFLKAKDINDYLTTLPNSNRPLLDTSIILNIALSAENAYNGDKQNRKNYQDTSIKYYEQLADAKLTGKEYEGVYGYLAYYFYQIAPNEEKLKKYLFIGKQITPNNKNLQNIEMDWKIKKATQKSGSKEELFNVYEEAINTASDSVTKKNSMQNYIAELFSYIYPPSEIRPNLKDYDERVERLESLYEELLTTYPNDLDIRFDYAKYFFNQFNFMKKDASPLKGRRNELLNQIVFNKRHQQKASGSAKQKLQREAVTLKADLDKVDKEIEGVKRQQEASADKVLEHTQGLYDKLVTQYKKGTLNLRDKNKLKIAIGMMLDMYVFKKDKDKVKELEDFEDSLRVSSHKSSSSEQN